MVGRGGGRVLPAGATAYDFIQGDGTQYIDTGVGQGYSTSQVDIETNIQYLKNTAAWSWCFFIGLSSNSFVGCQFRQDHNCINIQQGNNIITELGWPLDKYEASIHSGVFSIGGNNYSLYSGTYATNVSLLSFNTYGTNPAKARIWATKIWVDGTLVRDLQPCTDPNGRAAMYDFITRSYYYGDVAAGNDFTVGLDDAPYDAVVEYLEFPNVSNTTAFINLRFQATEKLTFEAEFYRASNALRIDCGAEATWSSNIARFIIIENEKARWRFGGTVSGDVNVASSNFVGDIKIEAEGYLATVTNLTSGQSYSLSGSTGTFTTPGNFLLMMTDINNSSVEKSDKLIGGRIKYAKITDNGVNLDLIPVRVGSIGYMFDKNAKRLYPNYGNSQFTLGNDVI